MSTTTTTNEAGQLIEGVLQALEACVSANQVANTVNDQNLKTVQALAAYLGLENFSRTQKGVLATSVAEAYWAGRNAKANEAAKAEAAEEATRAKMAERLAKRQADRAGTVGTVTSISKAKTAKAKAATTTAKAAPKAKAKAATTEAPGSPARAARLERYAAAKAAKNSGRRPATTKLDAEQLDAYLRDVLTTDPGASAGGELEVARWLHHLSVSQARFTSAFAAMAATLAEAKRQDATYAKAAKAKAAKDAKAGAAKAGQAMTDLLNGKGLEGDKA